MTQPYWLYLQTVRFPTEAMDPPPPPPEPAQFFRLSEQPYFPVKYPWQSPDTVRIPPDLMTPAPDLPPCFWYRPAAQPVIRPPVPLQLEPMPVIPRWFEATTRYYLDARGVFRVFHVAEYRLYWGNTPPVEGTTPQATAATLPATPPETFADGTWYFSASYFNGVLDSGFLPVGPAGETYLVLSIVDGHVVGNPPDAPQAWSLELTAGGVVRVSASLFLSGKAQPGEWAIGYTTDGSDPAANSPTATVAMPDNGLAVLAYDLPAQAHGTVVKVRLQTRRNDGTAETPAWTYSAGSTIQTLVLDLVGPTAPAAGDDWIGPWSG